MSAIYRVFDQLHEAPDNTMKWVPAIMMGAIAAWMYNAVMHRPSASREDTALAEACAYHVMPNVDRPAPDEDDDEYFDPDELVPCTGDRGLYFVSAFVRDERHGVDMPRVGLERERLGKHPTQTTHHPRGSERMQGSPILEHDRLRPIPNGAGSVLFDTEGLRERFDGLRGRAAGISVTIERLLRRDRRERR